MLPGVWSLEVTSVVCRSFLGEVDGMCHAYLFIHLVIPLGQVCMQTSHLLNKRQHACLHHSSLEEGCQLHVCFQFLFFRFCAPRCNCLVTCRSVMPSQVTFVMLNDHSLTRGSAFPLVRVSCVPQTDTSRCVIMRMHDCIHNIICRLQCMHYVICRRAMPRLRTSARRWLA